MVWQYFYGAGGELCPHTKQIAFRDVNIFRVGGGASVTSLARTASFLIPLILLCLLVASFLTRAAWSLLFFLLRALGCFLLLPKRGLMSVFACFRSRVRVLADRFAAAARCAHTGPQAPSSALPIGTKRLLVSTPLSYRCCVADGVTHASCACLVAAVLCCTVLQDPNKLERVTPSKELQNSLLAVSFAKASLAVLLLPCSLFVRLRVLIAFVLFVCMLTGREIAAGRERRGLRLGVSLCTGVWRLPSPCSLRCSSRS